MAENEEKQEQEFGKYILIEKLKEKFPKTFMTEVESENILVSTSVLLEGIHFSMTYFPLKHLGYKSVVSAISGIYSKGGKPEAVSVNMGVSSRYKVEDIESIIEGIDIACQNYELKISGLNIDSSLTGLTISITSTGSPDPALNTDIQPAETDLVCVTGDLGAAFMGLQLLERERKVFEETGGSQPLLEGKEYVIGRQLKPEIDTDIISKIKKAELLPSSVRVLKEGLASDLIGLAYRHGHGCRVYHEKIPFTQETADAGSEFNIEPLIGALSGGDDFEFMFTFPVADFDKLKEIEELIIVGHLCTANEGYTLALQDNSLAELKAQGWEEGSV
jgi:thiamine-monophosphate kinase